MSSNEAKSRQLGMPYGTAQGRLRKKIMFHLLQKHSENICHVCHKKIDTVDELSIEHILPWEGRSTERFWDIDNIAFSHLKCNIPHSTYIRPGMNQRRVAPEGKAWCRICNDFIDITLFSKHRGRWNGVAKVCIEHRKLERQSKSG